MNDLGEMINDLPQEKIKGFREEVINLMNDKFWCMKNGFEYENVNYSQASLAYYNTLACGDNF